MSLTYVLTTGGAGLVFVLLAARPALGIGALLAFYPLLQLVPRTPVPGLNAETVLVLFALILTFTRSGLRLPPLPVSGAVIAFILVMLMGWAIASTSPYFADSSITAWDRFRAMKTRTFTALLFFIAFWWAREPRERQLMLESISMGVLVVALAAVGESVVQGPGRAAGLFDNPNGTGYVLTYLLVPLYLVVRGERSAFRRSLHAFTYALGALALVLTLSRAAWLAGVVAHGIFFLFLNRTLFTASAVALLLAASIGYPFLPQVVRERVEGTFAVGQTVYRVGAPVQLEGSAASRVVQYRAGLDMAVDSPLWGHGAETFGPMMPKYGAKYGFVGHGSPHSTPLKLATETGLIGLGMLAWVGLTSFGLGWGLWRLRHPEGDLGVLLIAIAGGLSLFNLFHALLLSSAAAGSAYFWALLGTCAHLYYVRDSPARVEVRPARGPRASPAAVRARAWSSRA